MRRAVPFLALVTLLAVGLLGLAGCGGTDETTSTAPAATETSASSTDTTATTAATAQGTPTTASVAGGGTNVVIETSLGSITVSLDSKKAPATVENFLAYMKSGFYDGTIFHRVIPGFMIQGGGFTKDMQEKPTNPPIKNEAGNGLTNTRGTIAMARTQVVDSATSQFFINVVDNPSLDHRDDSVGGFGYAVFGKVTDGMNVVDKIAAVPTTTAGAFQDVPQEPVVITSVHTVQP